ncbi:MAG: oligosaccharide flippase family protein [Pelagibacterales bacterium]|nr:oligosaccharide flippase family protein [Pelagibacterales bacterium]
MGFIKSLKDISVIGIGDIAASSISAIFWFYLATLVLPEEYGEIHYLIGIATIASTLSLVGQQNTLTVYISKNKAIFSTLFFISLICSILSFIILFVFFNRFDIGLLAIGFVIFAHGIASNLGSQNFKKYTTYSILQKSLMLIFSLSIFYFFGIEWILLGIAFSYFIYTRIFFDGLKKNKFKFSEIKDNKKFIFSNYFLMLTNIITTQVDKLLIVPILGLAVLGNYSLAIQILTIMSILPSVIFKYILPRASRDIIDIKLRQNVIIFSFVLAGVGILVLPSVIPIFFERFTEVAVIIQIMSLSIIPLTINSFYYSKFLALENAKIPLYGGIVSSVVLVSGMIILGSVYGTIGIAITHVLTYSSLCLVSYIMNKRM